MALLESEVEASTGDSEDNFQAYLVRTYNAAKRNEATRKAELIARALEEGERAVKASRLAIEE